MYKAPRSVPQLSRWSEAKRYRTRWLPLLFALAASITASASIGAETFGLWRVSHGEDRVTRMKAWLATSPTVRAEDHVGNPLEEIESWLGFYCHEGTRGVFIGFFRVPNLPRGHGTETNGLWKVRTRWDDEVRPTTLRPNVDEKVLEFADPSAVLRLLDGSNSALIELPWQGPNFVYFVFPVSDARSALESVRKECGEPTARSERGADLGPRHLALRTAFARDRNARKRLEEARRREEERARRELMAREQQRLEQERKAIIAKALEEYVGAIQSSVLRNWRRPTGVPRGLKCTVSVVQAKNGKVLRVEIAQSSGNVAFDRSVEQAVRGPLRRCRCPRQRAVFEREILFLFNPRT